MIRRAALALLCAAWIAGCAVPRDAPRSDALLFEPGAVARADTLVIGIPGAFTTVRVLAPLDALATRARAIAYFRLPGFDGRPAAEWVDIDRAAADIARFAATARVSRVDLIGHSTGAVIALEAAKAIRRDSPDVAVRVRGISTALPAPQPVLAGLRGARGTLDAAIKTQSLNPRTVWLHYYRTLAYGPDAEADPDTHAAADTLVAANQDRITLPGEGLGQRHTRDLRRWRNPDPGALAGADIQFYHGAVDPVFPAQVTARFVDTLPGARLTLIDGHGHLLLLTYPQVWDRIIADLGP